MVTIRHATAADEDALFFLLVGMAAENSKHPIAVQKSLDRIREIISIGGVFVAEDGGEIVGSVGVSPQASWFSNATFLGDSWFFVRPDKRTSRVALMLKKAVFELAEKNKMDLVLAVYSIDNAERKGQFFARDMDLMGGVYVKEFD